MSFETWENNYVGKEKWEYKHKASENYRKYLTLWNKYKRVLGKNNLPTTFEKFQEMKYNDRRKYIDLKTRYYIKTKAKLTVHQGKQGKHILGHNNYQKGSYVFDKVDIQTLVNRYAGTGELKFDKNGRWTGKEFIYHTEKIGVHISKNKKEEYNTKRFSIHYSKDGVHIVPRERIK